MFVANSKFYHCNSDIPLFSNGCRDFKDVKSNSCQILRIGALLKGDPKIGTGRHLMLGGQVPPPSMGCQSLEPIFELQGVYYAPRNSRNWNSYNQIMAKRTCWVQRIRIIFSHGSSEQPNQSAPRRRAGSNAGSSAPAKPSKLEQILRPPQRSRAASECA